MLSEARSRMSASTLWAFQLMYSVAKAIRAAAARFETYGLGCRAEGLGCRAEGLSARVEGAGDPLTAGVVGSWAGPAPAVDAPSLEVGTEIPQPAPARHRRQSAPLAKLRSAVTAPPGAGPQIP